MKNNATKKIAERVAAELAATRDADDARGRARARRDAEVAALRDGRKQRAHRFPDRKKQASRDACRKKGAW